MNFSVKNLTRPKWLIPIVGLTLLIGWLVWPIQQYNGYAPSYIAVSQEQPESVFLGTVKVKQFDSLWQAKSHLDTATTPTFRKLAIGNWSARWSTKANLPDVLYLRHNNLIWTIEPSDIIKEHKRGDQQWIQQIEELAAQTRLSFITHTLKSSDIEATYKARFSVIFWEPLQRWLKKVGPR